MFNDLIIDKSEKNINKLIEQPNNSFAQKIIITDLFITYKIYKLNSFKFDIDSCLNEINHFNKDIYQTIIDNNTFFVNMFTDISNILLNSKFKTNFKLNGIDIDSYVYTNTIIKSMHYMSYESIKEDLPFVEGMIHRNVLISNIDHYSTIFSYLNLNKNFSKNTIKIVMILEKLISQQKIISKEKNNIRSDIYLKFNFIYKIKYNKRILLNYSTIPYKYTNSYFIGASYITFSKFLKKSNWQLFENKINVDALIKLSQQPIYIDFSKWNIIKGYIIDNICEKYNISIFSDISIESILNEMILKKIDQNNFLKNFKKTINYKFNQLYFIDNTKNKLDLKNLFKNKSKDFIHSYKINYILENSKQEDIINYKNIIKNYISMYDNFLKNSKLEENYKTDEFLEFDTNITTNIEILNDSLTGDIQRLYYMCVAEKALNINFPIYMSFYYDFRGRVYPKSALGFTYMKQLRPLYYIKKDLLLDSQILSSNYYKIICSLNISLPDTFNNISSQNKYLLIIHFLELGKLDKSNLNLNDGISLQNFVNEGINLFFNENITNIKLEDKLYTINIIENIKHFIDYNVFKDITIIRDSTASFLQHWGIKLDI